MRYGCVRDSHRLNVGEPVGIRQSRKNLLAKRSVIAKTIRYLDMFSGMGGFREGLTRAGRLRAGAKPPRPFCPASDFGGRKRVAPTGRLPRVETAGTHPACRDVRGWECGEKCRGGLPARVPGRLTPRECLRLQGWTDDRIDLVMPLHSDTQIYKQAGNGVTVNVVEAIGKRLAALHREVTAID